MKQLKQVHQFTPTIVPNDGVSNSLFYTQKILKKLGFISNIYSNNESFDISLKKKVYNIKQYKQSKENILLYHHSIGNDNHNQIMRFLDKKILVYHNITPGNFFKYEKEKQNRCNLGREQLKDSIGNFIASYTDSNYNTHELLLLGYKNVQTVPILYDFTKKNKILPTESIIKKHKDTYNILFVGRIVQNKAQHHLVDVLFILKEKGVENIRLFIVGDVSQIGYFKWLKEYVLNLELSLEVIITNKVSDNDLEAYYKVADLYVSLSEHEGFAIPLLEAMLHDTLVLAYDTGGINTTVPKECLVKKKSPSFIANKIMSLLNDPYLRTNILKKQKQHREQFQNQNIENRYITFLKSLKIKTHLKATNNKTIKHTINYQIEGPFDSTYSLSIVNQTTAKSLYSLPNTKVNLYATEGSGNFMPNLKVVDAKTKELALTKLDEIDVSLRNLYPPRTNAMQGYHKIIGPYGWEESKFPQEYVNLFNQRLSMIFTMSKYVENLLKNNGVKIPIITTGLVVENILHVQSKAFDFELPNHFKLLHISSCFPRKGVDKLLLAFNKLDISVDISLIIKTFPNKHNTIYEQLQNHNYKKITTYDENINLYANKNKKILLICKDISQYNLKYLYENCDLLVSPSFGEGFGLPMAEAMLCNLPVLTTGYGGQTDFCTENTSWLIDYDFTYAKTHMNLDNSVWVEPKVTSLKSQIENIYNLSEEKIDIKTKKAKQFILKNYSANKVSQNIQNAIEKYPKKKIKQKIGLLSTYGTKCGIAKYSSYLISEFEKEVTIFAPIIKNGIKERKNIVRCWDYGKTATDIELLKKNILNHKITRLVIQYNFGFFPLELLEELILFCYVNSIKTYLFLHSTKDIVTSTQYISLKTIVKSLKKITNIYIHSLHDINYLKEIGISKNTCLFTHGFDDTLLANVPKAKNITLATFGFLLPNKGLLELVDVLKDLHEKEGIKADLLLLTALYPSPISRNYKKALEKKIKDSNLSKYITLNTDFLDEKDIVKKLSAAHKILFLYSATQESSSAAVRMGLLSQNEVITTPLSIFDDIKSLVTQSDKDTLKTIVNSLNNPFSNHLQVKYIHKHNWKHISINFYQNLLVI